MGEREEVEALAEVIAAYDTWLHEDAGPIASAVLASDWLAAHDERVRASERERLAGEAEAG